MNESSERKKPDTEAEASSPHEEHNNRQENDEILIKRFKAAAYEDEIRMQALDVLRKRIASGEVSTSMLLRIAIALAKSNEAMFKWCISR
jgi:hypothetical protein